MIIRYWDIKREDINKKEKKSFFTKSNFDEYIILQSNEAFNEAGKRINMPDFNQIFKLEWSLFISKRC